MNLVKNFDFFCQSFQHCRLAEHLFFRNCCTFVPLCLISSRHRIVFYTSVADVCFVTFCCPPDCFQSQMSLFRDARKLMENRQGKTEKERKQGKRCKLMVREARRRCRCTPKKNDSTNYTFLQKGTGLKIQYFFHDSQIQNSFHIRKFTHSK